MNVAFDPFQTPHAPSFVQSWEMTSNNESPRRSPSLCGDDVVFGEGGM